MCASGSTNSYSSEKLCILIKWIILEEISLMVSHSSSLYRKSVALKILECSLVLLIWGHASKFLWEIVERLCWSVTLLLDFTSYFCKISASMARTFFSTYFDIFVGNYNNGFLASMLYVFFHYTFLYYTFLYLLKFWKILFAWTLASQENRSEAAFVKKHLEKLVNFRIIICGRIIWGRLVL